MSAVATMTVPITQPSVDKTVQMTKSETPTSAATSAPTLPLATTTTTTTTTTILPGVSVDLPVVEAILPIASATNPSLPPLPPIATNSGAASALSMLIGSTLKRKAPEKKETLVATNVSASLSVLPVDEKKETVDCQLSDLKEKLAKVELENQRLIENEKKRDDANEFLLDMRLLRNTSNHLFKPLSEKLLDTHSVLAIQVWDSDQSIKSRVNAAQNDIKSAVKRPSELVSELLPILFSEFDDPCSNVPNSTKSLCCMDHKWNFDVKELDAKRTGPKVSEKMNDIYTQVLQFAKDPENPFQKTATTVQPLMNEVVPLLNTMCFAEFDVMCHDIILATILKPCTELLTSPLRSAFKEGRQAYSSLMTQVDIVRKEVESAQSKHDLKTVVLAEESLITVSQNAIVSVSQLLTLIQDSKYAELFLNGSSGKLAVARAYITKIFLETRTKLEQQCINQKADAYTANALLTRCMTVIDKKQQIFTKKLNTTDEKIDQLKKEIAIVKESWHFVEEKKRITDYFEEMNVKTTIMIEMDRMDQAKKIVSQRLTSRLQSLAYLHTWINLANELLDLVQKVVDIGVDGVETELLNRLNILSKDKCALEKDLIILFTTRHNLLTKREGQLQTRILNIDKKNIELTQEMADAESSMEVERHAKLAQQFEEQQLLKGTTRQDLQSIVDDLQKMNENKMVTLVFNENKQEHPSVTAEASRKLVSLRSTAKQTVENALMELTKQGIDPIILVNHLKQLSSNQGIRTFLSQPPMSPLAPLVPLIKPTIILALPSPDRVGDNIAGEDNKSDQKTLSPPLSLSSDDKTELTALNNEQDLDTDFTNDKKPSCPPSPLSDFEMVTTPASPNVASLI